MLRIRPLSNMAAAGWGNVHPDFQASTAARYASPAGCLHIALQFMQIVECAHLGSKVDQASANCRALMLYGHCIHGTEAAINRGDASSVQVLLAQERSSAAVVHMQGALDGDCICQRESATLDSAHMNARSCNALNCVKVLVHAHAHKMQTGTHIVEPS